MHESLVNDELKLQQLLADQRAAREAGASTPQPVETPGRPPRHLPGRGETEEADYRSSC